MQKIFKSARYNGRNWKIDTCIEYISVLSRDVVDEKLELLLSWFETKEINDIIMMYRHMIQAYYIIGLNLAQHFKFIWHKKIRPTHTNNNL